MRTLLGLVFVFAPMTAFAEVLDKEFSALTVASWATFGALAAFYAARFKPWLLLIVLPSVGVFFWLHLSEFVDPFVGPALAAEGGIGYVLLSWASPIVVVFSCGLGFIYRVRRRRTHP